MRIQFSLQIMRNNYRGGNTYLSCTFDFVNQSVLVHNLTMCQEGMYEDYLKYETNMYVCVCVWFYGRFTSQYRYC